MQPAGAAPILILGAGAWGSALALALARAGCEVRLVSRRYGAQGSHTETDPAALLRLPADVTRGPEMARIRGLAPEQVADTDPDSWRAAILAVEVAAIRDRLEKFPVLGGIPLVLTQKGFERGTGLLPSEIVRDCFPAHPAPMLLSGPSFADEVAGGLPTALVLAASDSEAAGRVMGCFPAGQLRIYHSEDLIGTGLAGACKNILAVAAGITMGCGLGENARAALLTRGMAELARLIGFSGGEVGTLYGLAGLGDLVLSCTSLRSRNYGFGVKVGGGASPQALLAEGTRLVEGALCARVASERFAAAGIETPILDATSDVLYGHLPPLEAARRLLARPRG